MSRPTDVSLSKYRCVLATCANKQQKCCMQCVHNAKVKGKKDYYKEQR